MLNFAAKILTCIILSLQYCCNGSIKTAVNCLGARPATPMPSG